MEGFNKSKKIIIVDMLQHHLQDSYNKGNSSNPFNVEKYMYMPIDGDQLNTIEVDMSQFHLMAS